MNFRTLLIMGILALTALLPSANAARTDISRQEIRSMPITERPSRPGHFYGNTVRRNVHRRGN